jgi:hypothetical protein
LFGFGVFMFSDLLADAGAYLLSRADKKPGEQVRSARRACCSRMTQGDALYIPSA